MKVFDHSGHAGVRAIIIINVAGEAALNFLDIIHKVSLPNRYYNLNKFHYFRIFTKLLNNLSNRGEYGG